MLEFIGWLIMVLALGSPFIATAVILVLIWKSVF